MNFIIMCLRLSIMNLPKRVAPANIPQFQGNAMVAMATHGNDSNLMVEFFVEDVYQEFESEKQGRAIYKSVNKVRIFAPGNKSDIIQHVQMTDEPNKPAHPTRFPRQWQAFLAQQEQVPDGTPLEMCKFIPSHRVKELKAMHIHTAEMLGSMSDMAIQVLGMDGRRLRDLCKAFVSEDKGTAELSAALAREAAMKADLDAMKQQMAELNSRMSQQLHGEGKIYESSVVPMPEGQGLELRRRPGRPRKED